MTARLVALLWPLALPPAIVWLTAEGYLNLGGGEKDVLFALPAAVFAFVYMGVFGVMWVRARPTGRSVVISVVTAMVVLGAIAAVLYATSLLGV